MNIVQMHPCAQTDFFETVPQLLQREAQPTLTTQGFHQMGCERFPDQGEGMLR